MAPPIKWNVERRLKLAYLAGNGLTAAEISERMSLTLSAVRTALFRFDIELRHPTAKARRPGRKGPAAPVQYKWSVADRTLLKSLVEEGLSASKIAGRMGRTRNSVVAACRRYKLILRGQPWGTTHKAHTTGLGRGFFSPHVAEAVFELADDGCRWPLGDLMDPEFRFCGCKRQAKSSYCPEHHAVQFQPRGPVNKWPSATKHLPASLARGSLPTASTTRPNTPILLPTMSGIERPMQPVANTVSRVELVGSPSSSPALPRLGGRRWH